MIKIKIFLQKIWSARIAGSFITGLFVLLPFMLTFIILDWVIGKLSGVLGPETFIGNLLSTSGGTLVGQDHAYLSFIVGILLALVGIWGIGLFAKALAKDQLNQNIDLIFERLPIIRTIYKPVSQVVRLFNQENEDLKGMSVVACHMGGKNGVDILALMPPQDGYNISGDDRLMVYLPTSPLPMTGALVLMNKENIVPMPNMSVDELMQIYLSMGISIPESMKASSGL
jgi:uncharacterized membrane protein